MQLKQCKEKSAFLATLLWTNPKRKENAMLNEFKDWLLSQKYKQNTAEDYKNRIDRLCRKEKLTLDYLKKHLSDIIPIYGKYGKKESYGRLSHSSVINALRRFSEFLAESAN